MTVTTFAEVEDLSRRLAADGVKSKSTPDSAYEEALTTATQDIISHCGRTFLAGSPGTTRLVPPTRVTWDRRRGCWTASIPDFSTITLVEVDQGNTGTWTSLSSSDWLANPVDGIKDGVSGWPTETLLFPTVYLRPWGAYPVLRVTGTPGWTAIPGPVKMACLKHAAREVAQEKAPLGVVGFGDFGPVRVKDDPTTVRNLAPYCTTAGSALGGFA